MNPSDLARTAATYRGRGRVLRVKEGYNPNSSSLGSVVFTVHAAVLAAPLLLAGAAAWIAARFAKPDSLPPSTAKACKEGDT